MAKYLVSAYYDLISVVFYPHHSFDVTSLVCIDGIMDDTINF